jgi:hypothetical protein
MSSQTPSKTSLMITLTEPLVILRTIDIVGEQSPQGGGISPPSVLRGLLALDLVKPNRISSIEVELQAISQASWSEGAFHCLGSMTFRLRETNSGLGTSETRKFFSATQVFFDAASSSSHRRALSVERGVSHYTNESDHYQSPPPLPPPPEIQRAITIPVPAPVHVSDDTRQRGRMRVRRRSSADHLVFQRDPVAHHNRQPAPSPLSSFPPTTEEEVAVDSPTSSRFVLSPTSSPSSSSIETPAPSCTYRHIDAPPLSMKPFFTDTQPRRVLEHSRTASLGDVPAQSRSSSRRNTPTPPGTQTPTGKSHRSHASLSLGSIFGRGSQPGSPVHDEFRLESPQPTGRERCREKNSSKRHYLFFHKGKVCEASELEEDHKEEGDGWREFRKGP